MVATVLRYRDLRYLGVMVTWTGFGITAWSTCGCFGGLGGGFVTGVAVA